MVFCTPELRFPPQRTNLGWAVVSLSSPTTNTMQEEDAMSTLIPTPGATSCHFLCRRVPLARRSGPCLSRKDPSSSAQLANSYSRLLSSLPPHQSRLNAVGFRQQITHFWPAKALVHVKGPSAPTRLPAIFRADRNPPAKAARA